MEEEVLESRAPSGRDSLVFITAVLSALALVASLLAVGYALRNKGSGDSGSGPKTITVDLSEFAIAPSNINVKQGDTLHIVNKGSLAHNFEVKDHGIKTADLPAGASEDLVISLPEGSYEIDCAIAGHASSGMTGTLTVAAGSAGAAEVAATDHLAGTDQLTELTQEEALGQANELDAKVKARTQAFLDANLNGEPNTAGIGGQPLEPTKVEADGTKVFELTAEVVDWEVEPGKTVKAWTYNGTVPGPEIRLGTNEKVKFIVHNKLPQSTAIHWHGLIVPNDQDGVPDVTQDAIKPGADYTYEFVTQSTPAVGMYHSHHMAETQVPNGLAGAIFVGEVPLPNGIVPNQRITQVLNDAGNIGLAINGKSFPATQAYVASKGDWIEVTYFNEGLQIHPMHLHGMPAMVVARDGFALASPYWVDTVTVAPGERWTILVNATEAGAWAWHCHILNHAERADGMFGMVTALVVNQ